MRPPTILIATLAALTVWTGQSAAQEPPRPRPPRPPRISALEAIRILTTESRTGQNPKFAEISGRRGMPGPAAWRIVTWDSHSPSRLSSHVLRGRTLEEAGPDDSFYPGHLPEGFFSASKVRIDSGEAFRIADREALAAKVGFDMVDYRLRGREFSDEAVWSLHLLDVDERPVGHIDLSATSGQVLRTVWFRASTDDGPGGIEDSAVTGLRKPPPAEAPGGERNPPARIDPRPDRDEPSDIPLEQPQPERP